MINQRRIEDLCKISDSDGKPIYLTLHETFVGETNQLLSRAQKCLKSGDLTEVAKVFEILSITATAIGASKLSSVSKKITASIEQNSPDIPTDLNQAIEIYELCESDIKKLLKLNGIK